MVEIAAHFARSTVLLDLSAFDEAVDPRSTLSAGVAVGHGLRSP